jgi:hypothetical protein
MVPKIIILIGLLKLLDVSNKPLLCSGIYAGIVFLLGLMFGASFLPVIVSTGIAFALSTAYFFLLNYFSESWYYWPILVIGLFIGMV